MADDLLHLHSVGDRGVPHRERIVLQALEGVSLAQYALSVGLADVAGTDAYSVPDNFIWLGDVFLKKGDWVLVYTGPGTNRVDPFQNNQVHSLYWGRKQTVFYNPRLVPILFRIGGITMLPPPHPSVPLPQVAAIENKPT